MPKTLPWPQTPTDPPAGLGKGNNGARVVNTDATKGGGGGGDAPLDGKLVVMRRHVDWLEHQILWRWLLDSFEGGSRYRNAVYGPDRRGLPARNLFRHKREYPDPQSNPAMYQGFAGFLGNTGADAAGMDVGYGPYPGMLGADPAATAQDDDYEYRRSRTPVPEFVAEAVEQHLSKIFDQEIDRPGPQEPRPQPILKGGVLADTAAPMRTPEAPAPGASVANPFAKPAGKGLGLKAMIPVPQPIHDGPLNPEDPLPPGNPPELLDWWTNVDGRGTTVDDWMRETIAPLLLVLGCLDICVDHPKAPPGAKIDTQADVKRLGLDRCVASYILPQNMVWWRLDAAGRYRECLVREYVDPADRIDYDRKSGTAIDPDGAGDISENWRKDYVRWRYWTATESILFSYDGDQVLDRTPHTFGCVPIVRLIDYPKHRSPHIGKSRYEAIAEYQREYYNRDSELILSDTLQAHPFLSGPEDYCKADNTLSIGPGYVLPMKKDMDKGGYQGWNFISPPKDPADSLRKNKQDLIDMKDRRACLTKPAGAPSGHGSGHGSSTTSQSGISKQLDAVSGHKLLVSIAKSLARAERQIAEYALVVLRNGPLDDETRQQIQVVYPARFELFAAAEMTMGLLQLQQALSSAGEAPETEREILQAIIRQTIVGLSDLDYQRLDAEIDLMVRSKAALREKMTEMSMGATSHQESMEGDGSAEQAAGTDPVGQSGGTMVSNLIPAVM